MTSPASAGCHRLIREFDAVCVTTADEMAELVLGADDGTLDIAGLESGTGPSQASVRLLDALSRRAPRTVDDIAARAGLSVVDTQSELGLLQLDGQVAERERGWIRGR